MWLPWLIGLLFPFSVCSAEPDLLRDEVNVPSCPAEPHLSSDEADMPSAYRAEWMYEGSYGLMVHYLIAPKGVSSRARTRDFNRTVNAFDVDYFINQFKDSGADWLIFTIGQNTGYYCSSNRFLDREAPGRTSDRNLILEIARRVKELKKKWFVVYLPAEVTQQADEIKKAFGWHDADQTEFLNRYLEFVKDYSLLFGPLCDGWWFDGCYDSVHKGKWDWQRWIDAARAGNRWAAVAFNDGSFCVGREEPVSRLQDYLAGEVHLLENNQIRVDYLATGGEVHTTPEGHLRLRGQEPKFYMPKSRCVKGVQWHALVPIDSTFAAPAVPDQHYEDENLFPFVLNCRSAGGPVTLNVPISREGHIPDSTAAQLARLGNAVRDQMAGERRRRPLTKTQGTDPQPLELVDESYTSSIFKEALGRGDWKKALSMCSSDTQARAAHYWFSETFLKDMIPIDQLLSQYPGVCSRWRNGWRVKSVSILENSAKWGMFLKPRDEEPAPWLDRAFPRAMAFLRPKNQLKYVIDLPPITYKEWLAATAAAIAYRDALEARTREEYDPVLDKIRTALILDKTEFQAGEPIPCRVELRNESGKDIMVSRAYLDEFLLRVIDSHGNDLTRPIPRQIQYMEGSDLVRSGVTVKIWEAANLAETNNALLKPGDYQIQRAGGMRLWAEVSADPESIKPPFLKYFADPFDQDRPRFGEKLGVYFNDKETSSNTVRIKVLPPDNED
jgi:hypothetical protein